MLKSVAGTEDGEEFATLKFPCRLKLSRASPSLLFML